MTTPTIAPAPVPAPVAAAPTLKPYQQQVLDFLSRPYAAAWLGIGYGKTLTSLAALMTYQPSGHILVVAPKNIARSTWINEIQKWGLPIRMKSLITDEHDRELTPAARKAGFKAVFDDPPTMYFINQELLTQSPQKITAVLPVQADRPTSTAHTYLEHLVLEQAAATVRTRAELIEATRQQHLAQQPKAKKPAVARLNAVIRSMISAGELESVQLPCRTCGGDGCPDCCNGLVDQMPRVGTAKHPQIVWPFATLIIDESQGFASHASARFKALAAVRPAIQRVIELTGTPAPNGLHDLWSQIYLLDQGAALGHNITEYRRRYFEEKSVGEASGAKKYILRPGAEKEIYAAISHLVISAFTTKLQLPPLNVQDVPVVLPEELMTAYKTFEKELVLDIAKDYVDAKGTLETVVATIIADNRAILNSKLLQFASGALHASDPDDPSTAGAVEIIHNEKLHMLEHIVKNTSGPVLIAYYFRPDRDRIVKHLRATGIKGVTTFDGSRKMLADWNAGRIPALLLHPASAGHGLNFQDGGATLIWYTLSHSLAHYQQTNGRLYRTGQKLPVNILRLLTVGTIDTKMPGVLTGKAATQDDLLAAVSTQGPAQAQAQAAGGPISAAAPGVDETQIDDAALQEQIGDAIGQALSELRSRQD